jgi:gluconokinase
MGVSGCGKSHLGRALSAALPNALFIEGDELHPPANIAKMSQGIPLTDADRAGWLADVGRAIAQTRQSHIAIASCSALRRTYRESLLAISPGLHFVYLHGERPLLLQRLQTRTHFMPPSLLDSQLATLEPPDPQTEPATILDCTLPTEVLVGMIVGSF